MKILVLLIFTTFAYSCSQAQRTFIPVRNIECSKITSQGNTGTCWSFATSSFLESEVVRLGHDFVDLSEMFAVRKVYEDKASNYVFRKGDARFSQGSLSHDVIFSLKNFGVVPEDIYSGKSNKDAVHNHAEMEKALKGFLDGIIKIENPSDKWIVAFREIMNTYIGDVDPNFKYKGVEYTPISFAQSIGLNADDYVTITSFTHQPFYSQFVLKIPDNYSNGSYYNVKLEEMVEVTDNALKNGFTVAWDGDVSEKTFSSLKGLALWPEKEGDTKIFKGGKEMVVTQKNRQIGFDDKSTTDDHLMHIVGLSKDKKGNKFYLVKNSWGEVGPYNGYLYMSEAYFKAKTIAVMVHKDAVPKKLRKRLSF